MKLDDYGIWINIRGSTYQISDICSIVNAIRNEYLEEDLLPNITFRYRLTYNGKNIGYLISYQDNNSTYKVSSIFWPYSNTTSGTTHFPPSELVKAERQIEERL